MNGPSKKFNPIFAILALLSIGGFRSWNDSRVKAEKLAEVYNAACVDDVTQTQEIDPPKVKIEKLTYFKIPTQAENFRAEISIQFPDESRLMKSGATYVRVFFRIQKPAFEIWKPTLKLSKSSAEPTSNNEFSRMESFAWRLMVECKQDWWTPNSAQQSYRNFSSHPGSWLFDFDVSKVDSDKMDVYISGLMGN